MSDIDKELLRLHFDKAIGCAAVLAALSRHSMPDRDPLQTLGRRQQVLIEENLHLFGFHGRRAIELSELDKRANEIFVAPGEGGAPAPSSNKSNSGTLWWVLGRIVHSKVLIPEESESPETAAEWTNGPSTTVSWRRSSFLVKSDRDPVETVHSFDIHGLVRAFVSLQSDIEAAIAE